MRVQIHGAEFLQRGQRFRAHAALADHRAHAVFLDDVGLIRLFANAGGGAGGLDHPLVALLQHHRTAVVEHRAVHVDRRRILHQVGVHVVAAGEHLAVDQHDVADFQRAHLRFGQRRGQHHFAAGQREARAARHALHGPRRIAVQPLGDRAALSRRGARPGGGTPSIRRPPKRRSSPAGGWPR